MTATASPLRSLIPGFSIGRPISSGALTVFPLFGNDPRLEYRSFAEAAVQGFVIKELESGASVNDLTAINPLDVPVLLYEGEEVVGAQQDRTLDVTVLVGAGAKLRVPVSCVEQGRWDGSRHADDFAPSPRAAFPALRASKNRVCREALAAGREARADQGEVWDEVAAKGLRMGAVSDTGAMGGIYEGRADRIDALEAAFSREDGQLGMLAYLNGKPAVLDWVSRGDVFASLYRPLLRGYCLDALEHEAGAVRSVDADDAIGFVDDVLGAGGHRAPAVGLGQTVALTAAKAGGTALVVDEELIQLTVFAEDNARSARILRPSRRR